MKDRSSFSVPVTVVVLAILYVYLSTVFIFIERWFGLMSSPGVFNAVVFTFIALMCVFTYSVSVFTDPVGSPPPTHPISKTPKTQFTKSSARLIYCYDNEFLEMLLLGQEFMSIRP
ncbi:putative protein s-acyltransferase 16 [Quercus suber]|uniref:Uncharacterized protein n=1 Tax=Quercus suber TaxID=58331 RepID=A0AAW0K873_QUESU